MVGKRIKKNSRVYIFLSFVVIITGIIYISFADVSFFKNKNKTKVEITENDLDIVYGSDSSEMTIFLFSSYNCAFCRKFFKDVYPKLKKEYIDKNKVKLVVKPIALTKNESVINSLKIAVCINEYGDFNKLNELLLMEPQVVYTKEFSDVIEDLVQKNEFVAECMYGGESDNYISKNMLDFKRLKCTGTPTFVINNTIYKGFLDYEEFKKIVEKELLYALQ